MKIFDISSQLMHETNKKELLQDLKLGDKFSAKIIDIESNKIHLKLTDGTVLQAHTAINLNKNIGEYINLVIKSITHDSITIETLKENEPSNHSHDLTKELSKLSAKPNEETLKIVQTLSDNNLEISDKSLKDIKTELKKFSSLNLTAKKASFLKKNNLPITKANITMLNNFLDKNFNIANSLKSLQNNLSSLDSETIHEISQKLKVLDSFETVTKLVFALNELDKNKESQENMNPENTNLKQFSTLSSKIPNATLTPKQELHTKTNIQDTIHNKTNTKSQSIQAPLSNYSIDDKISLALNLFKEDPEGFLSKNTNDILNILVSEQEAKDMNQTYPLTQKENTQSILKEYTSKNTNNQTSMSEQELNSFKKLGKTFEKASSKPSILNNLEPSILNNLEPSKIMSKIKGQNTNINSARYNEPRELMRNIFNDSIITLDKNFSSNDIDIKYLYQKIRAKLNLLKDFADSSDSNDNKLKELSSSVSNLNNQLNFLNDINTHNTYIEIPIHYKESKTGELYILNKKNTKTNNKDLGTSIYLSLDTLNIGKFETLVNLKNNDLRICIRLESEKIISYVKNNLTMLYDIIQKTDYKIVELKCKKAKEKIDPLNIEKALKEEFIENEGLLDLKI